MPRRIGRVVSDLHAAPPAACEAACLLAIFLQKAAARIETKISNDGRAIAQVQRGRRAPALGLRRNRGPRRDAVLRSKLCPVRLERRRTSVRRCCRWNHLVGGGAVPAPDAAHADHVHAVIWSRRPRRRPRLSGRRRPRRRRQRRRSRRCRLRAAVGVVACRAVQRNVASAVVGVFARVKDRWACARTKRRQRRRPRRCRLRR